MRTRVQREYFLNSPQEFDLRPAGKIFMAEYAHSIAHKNEKLGNAGTLGEIRKALGG